MYIVVNMAFGTVHKQIFNLPTPPPPEFFLLI